MKTPKQQSSSHGFIAEPITTEDYVFGSSQDLTAKGFGGVQLEPDGDWEKHLYDLVYTHQAPKYETNACVSHGTANVIELLLRRVHGLSDDRSDRFIAKASGTDPLKGNSPKTVAQFIRDCGASSEDEWPAKAADDLATYYADIPATVFDLAKVWRGKFNFGYERIDPPTIANLREGLTLSPLGISCALMPRPDGLYEKPEGWRDGHWVVLLRITDAGNFRILDSYPDPKGSFIKEVRPFAPEVAMRYALDYERYSLLTKLVDLLQRFVTKLRERKAPTPPANAEKLYQAAIDHLGGDASPNDVAPDEFGCAESVNEIHAACFGELISPRNPLSTYELYNALRAHRDFAEVSEPLPGDIVISPTGYGTRKRPNGQLYIPNGHVGIVGREEQIMSADSPTGTWKSNYTVDTWVERYIKEGGYPMKFFRRL